MAKRKTARSKSSVLDNQMSFDFAFSETLETIDSLNDQVDQLDKVDQILLNSNEPKTTGDNSNGIFRSGSEPGRFESSSTGAGSEDDRTSFEDRSDQFTRLENSGSLVTGQSSKVEEPRGGGIHHPDQPIVPATTDRVESIGKQTPTTTFSGSRDTEQSRDTINAINAIIERSKQPKPVIVKEDYIISENELGAGNAKQKYRNNVAAIQLLNTLTDENRLATADEKKVLVQYAGWGGLPEAFDGSNEDWKKQFNELSGLLSPVEYAKARSSTLDAHYTPESVIKAMYKGLDRIGFKGGRILEPSVGIGNFIGFMPEKMRKNSEIIGIELDEISHKICKQLYPLTIQINQGYQDTLVPKKSNDAIIGNPPFGNYNLFDPTCPHLKKLSIHNYFIAKSLETLKPGGVMAFVVSRYFLDAKDSTARNLIAEDAHLLGAIRLPNDTFKQNALTEVTTDIVFFQKKSHSDEVTDKAWIDAIEQFDPDSGQEYTINQYYVENPEQLLGNLKTISGRFGPTVELLSDIDSDLSKRLDNAISILPENVYISNVVDEVEAVNNKVVQPEEPKEHIAQEDLEKYKVGAFFVAPSGKVAKRLPNVLGQIDFEYYQPKNAKAVDRIKGMIEIRDALRGLFKLEQSEHTEQHELDKQRQKLNQSYDRFIRKHGHVSSQSNRLLMREDPEWPLIHALERNYDKGISPETAKKNGVVARQPAAEKADIFFKRVLNPIKNITHVDNAQDALVVSMNETGRVDLNLMARLTQKSTHALIQDLEGIIYHNPAMNLWETKDIYLTGNVKEKLREAEQAALSDKKYQLNVEQLKLVQPADIDAVDISVQLGSTWVPADVVKKFVLDTLKVECKVSYMESLGKWAINIPDFGIDQTLNTVTWGTARYRASDLIEAIVQNKSIQVKDEIGTGSDRKLILNENETNAANQKADEIKQAFVDWIWQDQDRREKLARLYNDRFNTTVATKFDGSHLTLPSASQAIQLRPSQKNGIWRAIQTGGTLFDHVVGAGKTYTCVASAMESKRMGLIRKPMIVVPNHLTLEWKDAFYKLYPNANILVADKTDFIKQNREKFFANVAVGDWDAVIVGHSSFKKIAMPEQTLDKILHEQINDLVDAIARLRAENGDRLSIKEMEKAHKRMSEQLKKRSDTGTKDKAVDFADLGIDALFVDEAHEFKNLFITTSQSRISGLGNIQGSDKAFDLFVKVRYLQEKNQGRGVFFATGTPISNTIAEVFTMQRYMQYNELKKLGIAHFDAWASTFGQVVTGWELDATGVNYRVNSRFSKFQNVPELTSMYRSFADVISIADLHAFAEAEGTRFPIPKLKNGKPTNVVVPRSPEQARFMGIQIALKTDEGDPIVNEHGIQMKTWNRGSIIHRMENLPKDPSIDNPLKITNEARKAGLDFRLINPDADDFEDSKVNVAIQNMFDVWKENAYRRGTQLVFCDLSTPKKVNALESDLPSTNHIPDSEEDADIDSADIEIDMDELLADSPNGKSDKNHFSVYNDIKDKLIKMGIPDHEIKFIHDAKTDIQKAKLFDQVNKGEVRILLGSTAKMGAGTNVQKRLVALHNLDAPWRPSDLEQREGRLLRQGNMFYEADPDGFEVEIFRYATEQTYDSRMWQTIEIKASGIEQFRKGDSLVRVIDDIAGEAANAADMKAAASGNPLILMQVKLASELKKMEAVYNSYNRNKHGLERRIAYLSDWESRMNTRIEKVDQEINHRNSHSTDSLQFLAIASNKMYGKDDMEQIGKIVVNAMKAAIANPKQSEVSVGLYRGAKISVSAMSEGVYFTLTTPYSSERPENLEYIKGQGFNVGGFFTRLNNYFASYEEHKAKVISNGQREQSELESAKIEFAKPFAQLEKLTQLRNDNREIMNELRKVQADDSYVSTFKPKSLEETPKIKLAG
ncbi:helicase, Snf2 family [Acinetobacter junii CIP 107470 = MTCC 11364]|uniref:Helicase, Snf2 family n=1 Tax=Acinetobacter junii CIP 107470 = MTCC 11364 TaxID=1217666 RepID=S7WUQ3_ACIJU|nr:helicase-related protein [Acinetobacter junii]ENV52089.1 hypothetical protein F953_00501 [Acinetobacter junii CIP 107470 = MTCC 11364]EPR86865.1 helicase, Snf2 family [Acinetobacter junii CIP 107470 = MTCC 11364]